MVIHAPSLRTHISISRYITTLVTAGCYWNNFIIRIQLWKYTILGLVLLCHNLAKYSHGS